MRPGTGVSPAAGFPWTLPPFEIVYSHLLSLDTGEPYFDPSEPYPHTVLPFFNGNGVRGSTTGFEIVSNWKPAARWRLQPSYAYLHMDLSTIPTSRDLSTVNSLHGSGPHHQMAIKSYLDLPHSLVFSLMHRYVSDLPAQQVKNYHTVDAQLAWQAKPHLGLSITRQNLLQPQHPEFDGDPGTLVGIKRNLYLRVTWRQ